MDGIRQMISTTAENLHSKRNRGKSSTVDLAYLKKRVTTSPEEQQRLKQEATRKKLEQLEQEKQRLLEQLESANKQAEAQKKSVEAQNTCIVIAMRIMSGDTVPRADYKFLSKNNPELYAQAIMMRVKNPEPKKHKQLSGDSPPEETTSPQKVENSGNSSTQSPTPPSAEGGGEAKTLAIHI